MNNKQWFSLRNPDQTDSPTLLIYPDRVQKNIEEMIRIARNPDRLVVHVKTNKMPEVVKMMLNAGIHRFKCATIAESEMLAFSGAKNIVLAYPLNRPKAFRFLQLTKQYPDCRFAALVDNLQSAKMLDELFANNLKKGFVFIDIDNGMHRSGISTDEDVFSFYSALSALENLQCLGLHVYDGHVHHRDFEKRKKQTLNDFELVNEIIAQIEKAGYPSPEVIAGGTPTFPVHAENPRVLCSPGTSVLWDAGYAQLLPEQNFSWAAVLLSRVISKPAPGRITIDLGYKSVASENPIDKRIYFLNLSNNELLSQSEEHLVVKTDSEDWQQIAVGDPLYGVPYHICPTVALYDEALVVEEGEIVDAWQITARKRKIHI